MITVEAEISRPVVRMCDNPDCRGWDNCDRIDKVRPSMGVSVEMGDVSALPDDLLCAMITDTIAGGYATDRTGARHVIPGTAEFTVHKGRDLCVAVYSGIRDRDELLANAPLYEEGSDGTPD